MPVNKEKLGEIIVEIEEIIAAALQYEEKYAGYLCNVHPAFKESARNLIHYRAMRTFDLRGLQKKLGNLGLSRLAKAESHVMASLTANLNILKALAGHQNTLQEIPTKDLKKGEKLLEDHANAIFGEKSEGRRVRIMVTMPGECAHRSSLAAEMLQAGMDTARINCAHESPSVWRSMIANVRRAGEEAGRQCKVAMDLGGPKIRTGALEPGPRVLRIRPPKDVVGRITRPAQVALVPYDADRPSGACLPVDGAWLKKLQPGDKIRLSDARGKSRTIKVAEIAPDAVYGHLFKTAYIETGCELTVLEKGAATVGALPPAEAFIVLREGDRLVVTSQATPGRAAVTDACGEVTASARISCTLPEIVAYVKPGESILFDDGKIEGVIENAEGDHFTVRIISARSGGSKLRADRGINLPDTKLAISGLTEKDKADLHFIAEHADAVNMSFVNTGQDVQDLINEINTLPFDNKPGIILKIETKTGFQNLVEILLTAMQIHPVGVMIARGDLAIECGWENIGRVQEEILWLCHAAHIPTIWATQVLENLAKKGIPSRAEITDAVMSQRADCVMLNKGAHISSAIAMLNHILRNMQSYQDKKAPMLPPMDMIVS